jgi:hypothetical protein
MINAPDTAAQTAHFDATHIALKRYIYNIPFKRSFGILAGSQPRTIVEYADA